MLRRLKVHWKRARQHVHSPDPCYVDKLRTVRFNSLAVVLERQAFVFEDEFTLHRQPSLAYAYEGAGRTQPLAELGWKANYEWRIAVALHALTGQVVFAQTRTFDIPHLVGFYQQIVEAYPGLEIQMVQDNWPVHFHPDVRAALQPQLWAWPFHLPRHWPTEPGPKAKHLNLPIRILPLPTYASWANPTEKVWRLLRQEVLHLHRFGDDWVGLKQQVFQFLTQFAHGSRDLLRYVGLSDPAKLYRTLAPP